MFKNKLEYFAFVSLAGLFRILGITRARKLAKLLGSFFFYAVPIRKTTVIDNLKIAFPDKSPHEISALAKKVYHNFSVTFSELLLLQSISREEIKEIVDFSESDEIYRKHISTGKSLFILTGHFGNWELFAGIPLFYNASMNAMAKPMRNPYVSDWINKSRERFGVNVVLLGSSLREIYKVLKENGIVLSVGDQRGPNDGVRVNFFNRQTAVFSGTALLAVKTSSPIIMAFFLRQSDMNYKVFSEELKYDDLKGSNDEIIQIICQRYFSYLESMIKKYPEQWFWMHKIWKY